MQAYLDLLSTMMTTGVHRPDRTNTGTTSIFGAQLRFDLRDGFPLVTTKAIHVKSVLHELLWFLSGGTNVRDLQRVGVTIWDEWADDDGALGPVYGAQWRAWQTADGRMIDQLALLIERLRTDAFSRRHLVSAWNVGMLDQMALPPCHFAFQFYVAEGALSCMFSMRSVDVFLGLPFNIASYAFLTHMIAQQCDLDVGTLIFSGGDCHLYDTHRTQALTQLARTPYPLPTLEIVRKPKDVFSYEVDDFVLHNYVHHPRIVAPISV
ncbi:MAG: thymidylate synthase [Paenibacillaceae bacterium]|nr:thymidylate synthase [Paenibacillaceae bacterium]